MYRVLSSANDSPRSCCSMKLTKDATSPLLVNSRASLTARALRNTVSATTR